MTVADVVALDEEVVADVGVVVTEEAGADSAVAAEVVSDAEALAEEGDSAAVDAVVPGAVVAAGAEQRPSSLSHIVTKECSSHVERRMRWSPVTWYPDQRFTERRGFQST